MSRMHKPDPKLSPDQQDKRSVIPIERGDVDQWLAGTMEEAQQLLKPAPVEVFAEGHLGRRPEQLAGNLDWVALALFFVELDRYLEDALVIGESSGQAPP